MTVSEARRKANAKWDKENLTIIGCRLRKEKAEEFKQYAKNHNTTPNALLKEFINDCLEEK